MTETLDHVSSRRPIIGWSIVLLIVLLGRVATGVENAFHFSGPPVDGPFQLFNALRRIAVGQRGGADFQFFHGIGVPYLHYLPFRVLGGDLAASELTRQLTSIVAYPLVLVVFFRAFTRDWPRTLALSVIVYFISIALPLRTITTPAVSMLGIRSALPTLLAASIYVARSARARVLLPGLTLGVALIIGTEQGLAATTAFVMVSLVAAWRGGKSSTPLREMLGVVAVAVGTLLVLLLMIGGPRGVAGALRYNFRLVPGDQFWYFGAPASIFAPDWPSVFALMRQMPRIPVALVAAVAVIGLQVRRLWREPDGDLGRRHFALAILATYGLISCAAILGIFYDTYIEPCLRALLLIGALELDAIVTRRDAASPKPRFGVSRALALAAAGLFLAMVVALPSAVGATVLTLPHTIVDHGFRRSPPTPEGIWAASLPTGQRVLDEHRGPDGSLPVLWSTFSGWLEAKNGIFNPTQFDYTMHALGPENRAAYVAQFRRERPALVQTVLPMYLMAEIWMEQTSWEFYEELLRSYRAIAGTPWSIFWERLPTPNPSARPIWSTTLRDRATTVELPVANQFRGDTEVLLLSVQLDYRVHNPLRPLPFIGAIPRYFVEADNAISRFPVTLDPYTTSAHFPVIAVRGRNPVLRFTTYSLLPGARFDVRQIRVSTIPINQHNAGWLTNLIEQQRYRQRMGPGSDTTGRYRWR